jgi:hypothetical protein
MELRDHHVHLLEFLLPNGTRIGNIKDLEVLERVSGDRLVPLKRESQLFPSANHLYFIFPDDRVYEVHFRGHITVISFPRCLKLDTKGVATE